MKRGRHVYEMIRAMLDEGLSQREIARRLGSDPKTIRAEIRRQSAGLEPGEQRKRPTLLDRFMETIREKATAGMTALGIYHDLRALPDFAASYETVKKCVRRLRVVQPEVFMRLHAAPGEEVQVDFGRMPKGILANGRRPWFFVGVLSFSRRIFVCLVPNQKVATLLDCLARMFSHFGGVTASVKFDNMKSAIIHDEMGRREYQREFLNFSRHYGFIGDPCRPVTPTDKGKTESGVGYVKKAVKGRQFAEEKALGDFLIDWAVNIADERIHGTTKERPREKFEGERPALKPLPVDSFITATWRSPKVRKDCHVHVAGAWYSVPYTFAGRQVEARITDGFIEVFSEGLLLHRHARAKRPGEFVTELTHYPQTPSTSTHELHRRRLEELAGVGPAARAYLDALKRERRAFYGDHLKDLLRIRARHAPEKLEAAFTRALACRAFRYGVIERIIERETWLQPLEAVEEEKETRPKEREAEAGLIRDLVEYSRLLN